MKFLHLTEPIDPNPGGILDAPDRAFQEALTALEREIRAARTVTAALRLQMRLASLCDRASGLEQLALGKADALCDRGNR